QDAEKIEVEFDAGPAQDDYGRYLVYVYADGEMINEILVREGLAEVTYVNPPNDTHADLLYEAQERAQSEDLGIWSETNQKTSVPFHYEERRLFYWWDSVKSGSSDVLDGIQSWDHCSISRKTGS